MSATVNCSEQRKESEEFINKIVESCMLNNAQSYFRRSRFMAYRMMVHWCWGFLGKELRVPLPSCAVSAIRQKFPSENGDYTGFNYE
ncbi:MAG: hypothetical protein V2I33_17845 [Kangiellaceae bacterium]|jgi:hypothetical protein|nr:hypothetical protein [Kangiellaceae bacterium]